MSRMILWLGTVAMLLIARGACADERDEPATNGPPADALSLDSAAVAVTRNIDARIDAQLKSAGTAASPAADDAEFLRRVYLDLHGVVPTADRVRSFLEDRSADKRAKIIDHLLADPRFAAHLADLVFPTAFVPFATFVPLVFQLL